MMKQWFQVSDFNPRFTFPVIKTTACKQHVSERRALPTLSSQLIGCLEVTLGMQSPGPGACMQMGMRADAHADATRPPPLSGFTGQESPWSLYSDPSQFSSEPSVHVPLIPKGCHAGLPAAFPLSNSRCHHWLHHSWLYSNQDTTGFRFCLH